MISFGLILVLALTAQLAFGACAVASRTTRPGGDCALAVCILVSAGILVPIHALGFAHLLTAPHLTWTTLLCSVLMFVGSMRGRTVREHLRATLAHAVDTAQHAASLVFVDVRKAGPVAWAGVVALVFTLAFTTMLTWLTPSDSWDGIWYHDMMVGHAIQTQSYAEIPMSRSYMQQANGHPRNAEMLGLWWVIFSGRRLLEWPSVLAALPMSLACYGLCRRYAPRSSVAAVNARWRAAALLVSVALILLPGFRLEMHTTYIDGVLGAFSLAALYFAADPKLRAGRSVLAAVAIGLALGSKSHALLSMPLLAVLAFGIVAFNEGVRGWRSTAMAFFGSAALIAALGGVTYIRNWLWYGDPFWPFTVVVGPWTFEGMFVLADDTQTNDVARDLFMEPIHGGDWPDIRRGGYGLVTGFVLLPILAFTLLALLLGLFRHFIKAIGQRRPSADFGARLVLFLAVLTVILSLVTSPQLWSSRYNLYAVGFGFALTFWLASVLRAPALADHFAAAAFVTNCILWSWSVPGWWYERGADDLKHLLAKPRSHDVGAPSFLDLPTALARERELKPGDVVVFSDDVGFASLLWNDSYSNRLVYVPPCPPEEYLIKADAAKARWIAVGLETRTASLLRSRPLEWAEVGPLHKWGGNKMLVFRRLPRQD